MTPSGKLKEVLNVRLDEALARELRRIAATREQSESEVARWLLHYGIEVSRRLEAKQLSEPYQWQKEPQHDPWERRPGLVEIDARWREMTDAELMEHGLYDFLPSADDHEDDEP